MIVAPSIIAADFTKYQREIKKVVQAGADLLHLDVMDGVFVPNLTFGPMIVEAINRITDINLDAHLMIVQPEKYLGAYLDAGADWVSFHIEATDQVLECIDSIKSRDKKTGIAISPGTSFQKVTKYLEKLDFILVMGVNPGFYGQEFIPDTIYKIKEAKEYIVKHDLACLIQVDGGISQKNALSVSRAGADILVAGAGIFKNRHYKKAIENLRCLKV